MKTIVYQQQQCVQKESSAFNQNMEMLASLPIRSEHKNLIVKNEHYKSLIDICQYKKNQIKINSKTERDFVKEIYNSVTNIEKNIMNNSKTDFNQLISNCAETIGKDKLTTTTPKLPMANSNNLIDMNNSYTRVDTTPIVVDATQKENIKDSITTPTTTTISSHNSSKSLYTILSKSTTPKKFKKLKKNIDTNNLNNNNNNDKLKIVASLSSLAKEAATNSSLNENNNNNNTKTRVNQKCTPKTVNKIKNGIMSIKNSNRIPSDILDDLASRFVINVPDIELSNLIRICFQIELAHWFYLDFFCNSISKHQNSEQNARKKIKKKQLENKRNQKQHLSSTSSNDLSDISNIIDEQTEQIVDDEFTKHNLQPCGIKYFALQLFQHIPFLRQHSASVDKILEDWKNYKLSVPTFGAILVSEDLNYCLLVQSYFAKTSWGFPKGKVNENEDPVHCATREVYEETGYNISSLIDPNDYIEAVINYQYTRLYIVRNVSLTTEFAPRTRYEIRCCDWFPIDSLPVNKSDAISTSKLGIKINSFFMIMPFVKRLKRWVNEKRTPTDSTTTTSLIQNDIKHEHQLQLQHSASANEFKHKPSRDASPSDNNNKTNYHYNYNSCSDITSNSKIKLASATNKNLMTTMCEQKKKRYDGTAFNNKYNTNINTVKNCMTTKLEDGDSCFFKHNKFNKMKGIKDNKQKYVIHASKSAAKISYSMRNRPRHKSMGDLDDHMDHVLTMENVTVMQRLKSSTPPIIGTQCTPLAQHNTIKVNAYRKLFHSESIQETTSSSSTQNKHYSEQSINFFRQQSLTNTPINTSNVYTNDHGRKNFSRNINTNLFKKNFIQPQAKEGGVEEKHAVYFRDNITHKSGNKQKNLIKQQRKGKEEEEAEETFELAGCLQIASNVVNNPIEAHTPKLKPTPTSKQKSTINAQELLTIATFAASNGKNKQFAWKNDKNCLQLGSANKSYKTNQSNLPINKNLFNDWDLDAILFNSSSTDNSSESSSSSSTYSGTSSTGSAASDFPLHSLTPSPTTTTTTTALIPQNKQKESQFVSIQRADMDLANPSLFMSPITTAAELEAQVIFAAKKCQLLERDTKTKTDKLENIIVEEEGDKSGQIDKITINAWRNFTFTKTIVSNVFY